MAKKPRKLPDGKKRTVQPLRHGARQDTQKRKLLQKHYNNKYQVR